MSRQPPWEIQVGRKADILAEFSIPSHKLQANNLKAFLRAIVVRYRTDGPEDMAAFYVNRRKGLPTRLPFAEVEYAHDPEKRRVGYFCGDWECYAFALQEIDAATAQWLKETLQTSKKG